MAPAEIVDEADGEELGAAVADPVDVEAAADDGGLARACDVPLEADEDRDGLGEPCTLALGCPAAPGLADGLAAAVLGAPEAAFAGAAADLV